MEKVKVIIVLLIIALGMCACNSEVSFELYVENAADSMIELKFSYPVTADVLTDEYNVRTEGEDSVNMVSTIVLLPGEKKLVRKIHTSSPYPLACPQLEFNVYVDGERVGVPFPCDPEQEKMRVITLFKRGTSKYTLVVTAAYLR